MATDTVANDTFRDGYCFITITFYTMPFKNDYCLLQAENLEGRLNTL